MLLFLLSPPLVTGECIKINPHYSATFPNSRGPILYFIYFFKFSDLLERDVQTTSVIIALLALRSAMLAGCLAYSKQVRMYADEKNK